MRWGLTNISPLNISQRCNYLRDVTQIVRSFLAAGKIQPEYEVDDMQPKETVITFKVVRLTRYTKDVSFLYQSTDWYSGYLDCCAFEKMRHLQL